MNSKDLLRALGDIDDKYIDEEYDTPKEKNKKEKDGKKKWLRRIIQVGWLCC